MMDYLTIEHGLGTDLEKANDRSLARVRAVCLHRGVTGDDPV